MELNSHGSARRNGVDEIGFFVLNYPIKSSCDMVNAAITRPWTSGQNVAPLSYS